MPQKSEMVSGRRQLSCGRGTNGSSFSSFSVVRIMAWLSQQLLKWPAGGHRKYFWKPRVTRLLAHPTSYLGVHLSAGQCLPGWRGGGARSKGSWIGGDLMSQTAGWGRGSEVPQGNDRATTWCPHFPPRVAGSHLPPAWVVCPSLVSVLILATGVTRVFVPPHAVGRPPGRPQLW